MFKNMCVIESALCGGKVALTLPPYSDVLFVHVHYGLFGINCIQAEMKDARHKEYGPKQNMICT